METDESPARLTQLADRLDCLTEEDFGMLTDTAPGTREAWRKRSEGPAYVRAGNRFLYPRKCVAEWLEARVKTPKCAPVAGLL